MNNTNCPNCAAPIDTAHTKCPYCGTPYPKKTLEQLESGDPCKPAETNAKPTHFLYANDTIVECW